ncbi:hypothetical protein AZI98_01215 [Aeribacillus pallidus]|uniref:Uncharacterized protein n=1 Tax=Aeribacillus pallidus TaxID=33936 RepID=A0A165Z3L3_9BACI|nr:hypothetical protein AZI98_01215 [Aeribacillus pallidus]
MIFLHSTQNRSKKMSRHIKGDLQMILAGGRVWNCCNSSQHPENSGSASSTQTKIEKLQKPAEKNNSFFSTGFILEFIGPFLYFSFA